MAALIFRGIEQPIYLVTNYVVYKIMVRITRKYIRILIIEICEDMSMMFVFIAIHCLKSLRIQYK